MLKTCFGFCPLRHGVSVVAIINLFWNIFELLRHIEHRHAQYERFEIVQTERNTVAPNDNNATTASDDYGSDWMGDIIEQIPATSEIFMDYIFTITVGWIALEFIANCCLKQSTFKRAPEKLYAWLVVYYANVLFMLIHVAHSTILLMRHKYLAQELFTPMQAYYYGPRIGPHIGKHFGHYFQKLIYIVIITLEIAIVHSYYNLEEKQKLNDIIQLKWKYVSRGEVLSKGIDYSSASTFNEMTSRQTQEGSRIPPYITNIKQN